MGNSQPVDRNETRRQTYNKVMIPLVSEMTVLTEGSDIRYGEIKIMKTQKGTQFVIKQQVFPDESQFQFHQAKANQIIKNQSDEFTVRLLDLQHNTKNEFCASFITAYNIYEYYTHDLSKDLEQIRLAQKSYEEIEIIAMLFCISNALRTLKLTQKTHGDIRPITILMDGQSINNRADDSLPNPTYKITDIEDMTGLNAYRRSFANINPSSYPLYLSPEQLEELRQKNMKPIYDQDKSDMFCLGLAALEMANLNDISIVYDMKNFEIIESQLEQQLQMIQQNYSPKFLVVIEHLLNMDAGSRTNSVLAQTLFSPYQFQLSDYFNNSQLKQLSMAFSEEISSNQQTMQVQQQGTHQQQQSQQQDQQQQFFPPPPSQQQESSYQQQQYSSQQPQQIQYKEVAQPKQALNNISNQESYEYFKYIDNLDNRVKIALKRSSDSQKLYQSSRIKELYVDKKQSSIQAPRNFDLYSDLPQITQAQLSVQTSYRQQQQELSSRDFQPQMELQQQTVMTVNKKQIQKGSYNQQSNALDTEQSQVSKTTNLRLSGQNKQKQNNGQSEQMKSKQFNMSSETFNPKVNAQQQQQLQQSQQRQQDLTYEQEQQQSQQSQQLQQQQNQQQSLSKYQQQEPDKQQLQSSSQYAFQSGSVQQPTSKMLQSLNQPVNKQIQLQNDKDSINQASPLQSQGTYSYKKTAVPNQQSVGFNLQQEPQDQVQAQSYSQGPQNFSQASNMALGIKVEGEQTPAQKNEAMVNSLVGPKAATDDLASLLSDQPSASGKLIGENGNDNKTVDPQNKLQISSKQTLSKIAVVNQMKKVTTQQNNAPVNKSGSSATSQKPAPNTNTNVNTSTNKLKSQFKR